VIGNDTLALATGFNRPTPGAESLKKIILFIISDGSNEK
jgi:hypothetical protein